MKELLMFGTCMVFPLLFAQSKPDISPREQLNKEEVSRLEREVGQAMTRRDTARLEQLLADDFEAVNPLGLTMRKTDVLSLISSPAYELEWLENRDIRVRVFGDVALATARGIAQGRYQGEDASSEFTYLRIWVRRGGQWQAVAAQATTLSRKPQD